MKPPAGSALFSAIVATPFGHIGIRTATGQVIELVYLPPHFEARPAQDAVAELAADQVTRYCRDPDFVFDLPLAPLGSAYQNKVWAAPRAIGQACGNNFFPLVIPCHRVTAAGGLGGFAHSDDHHGFLLGVKRWLLAHEGAGGNAWQQTTLL